MYWNHRIVHKDEGYGIHEVDYNDEGEIIVIMPEPQGLFAETIENLHKVLDMMKKDITKNPRVLEYEAENKEAMERFDKEYR